MLMFKKHVPFILLAAVINKGMVKVAEIWN
jgi:hypothetical protein